MSKDPSFNLLMINLFVGLIRGHRYLHPTSDSVRKLGYVLFRIEPRFVAARSTVNPEAIACSELTGHTLMTEWSEETADRKREQLTKYAKVQARDLRDHAAVPPEASKKNGLWLVVRPGNAKGYIPVVKMHDEKRMLVSSFTVSPARYVVDPVFGSLLDTKLSDILRHGINATRIPLGYIRVSLDDLGSAQFADAVVQQIVSLVSSQRVKSFTVSDICLGIFPKTIWSSIDTRKREPIARCVRKVVNRFSQKKYCQAWVRRTVDSPPTWEISVPPGKHMESFLRKVEHFSAEELGQDYQMHLWDDRE